MLLVTHVSDSETPFIEVFILDHSSPNSVFSGLYSIYSLHLCYQLTQAIEQDLYLQ